ncbi:putative Clr5 domain-containing protein [Seiridium cardinale]
MPEQRFQAVAAPDWERYRTRITKLYALYTLPELMQIMREEHQFVASKMVYKKHLRKWGVQKNLRSQQVAEALGKPLEQQLGELSSLYVGLVDEARIRRYIDRVSEERRTQLITAVHGDLSTQHVAQSLHSIKLKSASIERYFFHVQEYVTGMFGSGAWSRNWMFNPSLYGKNFESFDLALTAKTAADQGHTSKAFRIIGFIFEQLEFCMKQQQEADILVYFHSSAVVFYSLCPELARKWSKFIWELSRIYYNTQGHPSYITGWIESMLQMSCENWSHFSIQVVNLYCKALSENIALDSALHSHIIRARVMILSRLRSAKVATVSQEDLLSVGRLTLDDFGREDLTNLFTKFTLAGIRFDEGHLDEVHQLVTEILQSENIDLYLEVKAFCYRLLLLVANRRGHLEEEMLAAQQSLSFCTAHFSLGNELTVDALHDMENLLRSRGQEKEAEAYRHVIGDILDQIGDCLDQVAVGTNHTPGTIDAHNLDRRTRLLASSTLESWRCRELECR